MQVRTLSTLVAGLSLLAGGAAHPSAAAGVLTGVVRAAGRAAADVVVWVDAPVPPVAPVPAVAVMDQRNMQFVPRVLAVRVGTPVRMPNSDRLFHNVFSFRDGKVFDLGLYPVGASRTVTFDRPGVSRLFCNIHPNMAAYVVSVASPYLAVTDAAGRFTIADVPAGEHAYHAWRAGRDEAHGTLLAGGTPVELALP